MFLLKQECYSIVGAAMEVHSQMGKGFLESVYQEALAVEFMSRNIPFEREKELELYYKGVRLNKTFRSDFLCYEKIIVELKAVKELLPEHEAQLLNYLKVSQKRVGLLINFAEDSLVYKRYIL